MGSKQKDKTSGLSQVSVDDATDAPIKVLLVDAHEAMLWGLERLIEGAPNMRVVGKATNHKEALAAFQKTIPDVVLLDLDLDGQSGFELMDHFLKHNGVKILISTGLRDVAVERRAMLCGARGIIRKSEPVESILRAIDCIHDGEVWLNRAATADLIEELTHRRRLDPEAERIATLTTRERKIIEAVASNDSGTPSKEIAMQLNLSESTLRNHLTSIYGKLDVANRLGLVLYATRHGLVRISYTAE